MFKLSSKVIEGLPLLYVNPLAGGDHRLYSILETSNPLELSNEYLADADADDFIIVDDGGNASPLPNATGMVRYKTFQLERCVPIKTTENWLKYDDDVWLSKARYDLMNADNGTTVTVIAYSEFDGVISGEVEGVRYVMDMDDVTKAIGSGTEVHNDEISYVKIETLSGDYQYIPIAVHLPPHVKAPYTKQLTRLEAHLTEVLTNVSHITTLLELSVSPIEEVKFVKPEPTIGDLIRKELTRQQTA